MALKDDLIFAKSKREIEEVDEEDEKPNPQPTYPRVQKDLSVVTSGESREGSSGACSDVFRRSSTEIWRAVGFGGEMPTLGGHIIGTPSHHRLRMNDKREKDQIVQYEPTHKWWQPPARAWIFGLNREILAGMVVWNVVVTVLARYTSLCGDHDSHESDFCAEEWIMAEDTVYNVLGVGMFLLLAFRAHDGYDRFWEGRSALGRLRECCRDLTRQICFHVVVEDSEDSLERRRAVGFVGAFASTLKLHLRKERNAVPELGDVLCFQDILNIERSRVMPQLCLDVLSKYIVTQHRGGKLGEVTMSAITQTCFAPLVDAMGTCERIRNTPVPLSYVLHLRWILVLWLLFYPFHLIAVYHWYTILLASLLDFAVLGIESMACEVENPFGYHKNCIDMCAFCKAIVADTQDILARVEHPNAAQVFDGKEVRALNHRLFCNASPEERRELEVMAKATDIFRVEPQDHIGTAVTGAVSALARVASMRPTSRSASFPSQSVSSGASTGNRGLLRVTSLRSTPRPPPLPSQSSEAR